jgi:hypothetical protein
MRALAALLLGCLLAGAAGAYETVPDPAVYQETLAPYGGWANDATYGRVWCPAVAPGWRPYSVGHWDWSPWGWTWVSEEPWGWTYHYGRWVWLPTGFWGWVPGVTWGPAWVEWYTGPGWIGWRPLPPFGYRGPFIQQYVFVHERDFCAPHLRGLFVDHRHLPRAFVRDWGRHGFRPPHRDHVARISGHPIRRLRDRSADMLPPHRRGTIVGGRPERPRGHGPAARPVERPTRRPERAGSTRVPRVGGWVRRDDARGSRSIVTPGGPRGGVKGWRSRSEVGRTWRPQGGPVLRGGTRAGRGTRTIAPAPAGSAWSGGGPVRAFRGSSATRAAAGARGRGGGHGHGGHHSTFGGIR